MNNYNNFYQHFKVPETYQLTFDETTGKISIGAGYNLSEHTPQEIINDLSQAGFDSYTATTLAQAGQKTGISAKDWTDENRFLIISDKQHQDLFEQVVIPQFEVQLNSEFEAFQNLYPNYFSNANENLSETQKEILFQLINKREFTTHPDLVYAVINEDWDTVKVEIESFDDKFSNELLSVLLSEDNSLSQESEKVIDLTISTNYDFTYNQEIGHQGQSLIPHFPGGKSGVTIGPGYDMGHRSSEEIYRDLTAAGIDPDTAEVLMQAANKTGAEAQNWVSSHANIHITDEQQKILYYEILVPEYESRTQEQLNNYLEKHPEIDPQSADWDSLSDKQRQMLFDFTYNAGLDKFPTFVESVLKEDWDSVYQSFERYSAGELLAFRNESFYEEFLEDNLHQHYVSHDEPTDANDDYQSAVF